MIDCMILKMFNLSTIIPNNTFLLSYIAPTPKADNGCDAKLFDTAVSEQRVNEDAAHVGSNKKK